MHPIFPARAVSPLTFFSLALLAALALFSTGCVSTANVGLPKDRLPQITGATMTTTARPRPDCAMFKAGNAMFGMVGGLAAVSAGNELVRKYDIQDPAPAMAEELVRHLATTLHVVPQAGQGVAIDTQDVPKIADAAQGKADLVLDVQTVNWSYFYLPTKWMHYRLMYTVKLRLIDVRTKQLVAEGFYAWKEPEGTAYPTYDEMIADNAAKIREDLKIASAAAVEAFKTGVLKPPS
jgi:hypothetical protein